MKQDCSYTRTKQPWMFRLSLNSYRIIFGKRNYRKPVNFEQNQKIKCIKKMSRIRWIWTIRLTSLNSFCENCLARNNSPRIHNSRYNLSSINKFYKTLIIFSRTLPIWRFSNSQNLTKAEVKHLVTFEHKKLISSMGYKKNLLKIIVSIGKNWLKQNFIEYYNFDRRKFTEQKNHT